MENTGQKSHIEILKSLILKPSDKVNFLRETYYEEKDCRAYALTPKRLYYKNLFFDLGERLSFADEELLELLRPDLEEEETFYLLVMAYMGIKKEQRHIKEIKRKEVFKEHLLEIFMEDTIRRRELELQERWERKNEELLKELKSVKEERQRIDEQYENYVGLVKAQEKIIADLKGREPVERKKVVSVNQEEEVSGQERRIEGIVSWIKKRIEEKEEKRKRQAQAAEAGAFIKSCFQAMEERRGIKENIDYLLLQTETEGYCEIMGKLLTAKIEKTYVSLIYENYLAAMRNDDREVMRRWMQAVELYEQDFSMEIFLFFKSIINDKDRPLKPLFLMEAKAGEDLATIQSNYLFYEKIQKQKG